MDYVKVDPEVKGILKNYFYEKKMGPEIRIRTLGIGCMGAVFDLVSDVRKAEDIAVPFEEFIFLADRKEAETFGGYLIVKSKTGIRVKSVNKITGGCETCYNTLTGEGCH